MAIPLTPPVPVAETPAADDAKTMKAIVQHSYYGAPDSVLELEEFGRPLGEDDEMSIRVHAASVNPADTHAPLVPFYAKESL